MRRENESGSFPAWGLTLLRRAIWCVWCGFVVWFFRRLWG